MYQPDGHLEAAYEDRFTPDYEFQDFDEPENDEPDDETIVEWITEDGGCEATDGCWVEPDGTCEHGSVSWALAKGFL